MSSQLKLTDITKKFEANTVNEKVALDHLNLTVEPGQFVTVLGSNGSGKSTLMNVLSGIYPYGSYEGNIISWNRSEPHH